MKWFRPDLGRTSDRFPVIAVIKGPNSGSDSVGGEIYAWSLQGQIGPVNALYCEGADKTPETRRHYLAAYS